MGVGVKERVRPLRPFDRRRALFSLCLIGGEGIHAGEPSPLVPVSAS